MSVVALLKSMPRIELTEAQREAIKSKMLYGLDIASSVATVERVADENDAAIKRVMKCHKPECAGRRCSVDCQGG